MLPTQGDTNDSDRGCHNKHEENQTTDEIAGRPGFCRSDRERWHVRGRIATELGRYPLAQSTCDNCGEVFEDQEFCPNCGQWVGSIPTTGYEQFDLEETPEIPEDDLYTPRYPRLWTA